MWNLLIPAVSGLIEKLVPDPKTAADAKLKMLEMAQRGELAELDAQMRLALGQIEINKIEAAAPGLFKGGWRPMTGWLCTAGLGYQFLLQPILPWAVALFYDGDVPPLPPIDLAALLTLLGALLGVGTMRHKERLEGKA